MARGVETLAWPGGAEVAVCLTFDVDAEAPWLARSDGYEKRLSTLSEGRYGIVRALPRILDLLGRHRAAGTFYVPGSTAARYPDCVRAIAAAGHEIGHHGHLHLRSHEVDEATQRDEVERGLAALEPLLDGAPAGYRSPAWELTPATFKLLIQHGFTFDSSCMGDDRPYLEEVGRETLLELPVHWSLDDWPYYGWSVDAGGNLFSPSLWFETWSAEFDCALAERRLVTYTMHPEVIGRGHRLRALDRLMEEMSGRGKVWFATHSQVAALVTDAGVR